MGQVNIGGVVFDIYGTATGAPVLGVLSAQQYFAGSTHASAYTTASGANQNKALVTATRMLNRTTWVGTITNPLQALAWPRTGVTDCEGQAVDPAVIPSDVIYGSYELANALLGDATVQTATSSGSNVRRQLNRDKVGDLESEVETEYFLPTIRTASRFPTVVQEYLACFLASGASVGAPFASGTDVESQFDDPSEQWGFFIPGIS